MAEVAGKGLQDKGDGMEMECAVCLQNCVFPVQLPCKHIFCFLCVKGISLQSKRCAMCRSEIPQDYLFNPELLSEAGVECNLFDDEYLWFYEGRGGWWQYDQRTSVEIEKHFKEEDKRCELLIAGFLYIIDFEHMFQYRRNDPSRRRKVKRDIATGPKKGVAGLRIGVDAEAEAATAQQTAAATAQQTAAATAQQTATSNNNAGDNNSASRQGARSRGRLDADSLVSQATAATDSRSSQSPSDQSVSHRQSARTSNLSDDDARDSRLVTHHDVDSDDVNDGDEGGEIDEVSSQLEELGISQTTRSSTL